MVGDLGYFGHFYDLDADNLHYKLQNVMILKKLHDRGYKFSRVPVHVDVESESEWAVYFLESLLDILFGYSIFGNGAHLMPQEIYLHAYPELSEFEIDKDKDGRELGYSCAEVRVLCPRIKEMVAHWRGVDSPNFDDLKDILDDMAKQVNEECGYQVPVITACRMTDEGFSFKGYPGYLTDCWQVHIFLLAAVDEIDRLWKDGGFE